MKRSEDELHFRIGHEPRETESNKAGAKVFTVYQKCLVPLKAGSEHVSICAVYAGGHMGI